MSKRKGVFKRVLEDSDEEVGNKADSSPILKSLKYARDADGTNAEEVDRYLYGKS